MHIPVLGPAALADVTRLVTGPVRTFGRVVAAVADLFPSAAVHA